MDTTLRLGLTRQIIASERLEAKQQVCDMDGPAALSPEPNIPSMNLELPPPVVLPLIECADRIYVDNVFGGATVKLTLRGDFDDSGDIDELVMVGCFDAPLQYFPFTEEGGLKKDTVVTAEQGYPDCDLWSPPSAEVTVEPREMLPKPDPVRPCVGSKQLVVRNLEPGALVTILNNDTELGTGRAAHSTDTFKVPALEPDTVLVKQKFCDFEEESVRVPVIPRSVDRCPSVGDIVECATVVHLRDVHPGARIRLDSAAKGAIGEAMATSTEVAIRVPALTAYETVTVIQEVCGDPGDNCSSFNVVSAPWDIIPQPRIIKTPLHMDRFVKAGDILNGAIVEVYVNGIFRGSVESGLAIVDYQTEESGPDTVIVNVPIHGTLTEGAVTVLQRICGRASSPSRASTVRSCRKRIRVGLKIVSRDEAIRGFIRKVDWMRELFAFHGYDVVVVGEPEYLDLPDLTRFDGTRAEYDRLTSHRNGLGDRDIGIYLVDAIVATTPEGGDIAGHIFAGGNGAVVERGAPDDSVAHEVAHLLIGPVPDPIPGDPYHTSEDGRLLDRDAGSSLPSFAGALTEDELRLMDSNHFALDCGE
ncbi:MAG: hypothetical protein KJ077_25500 [Anaerolineae bacterium]|nr:hypothetical protein [Anaerolineae bacterium]